MQRAFVIFLVVAGLFIACEEEQSPAPNQPLSLLPPGQHVTVFNALGEPGAYQTIQNAFMQCLNCGIDTFVVFERWNQIESTPGVIDISNLQAELAPIQSLGLKVHLVINTIDTNVLALPGDLLDPTDPTQLAGGRHFDDPVIINRFAAVLDAVVPFLQSNGGFYLSVGNEVNIWLDAHTSEISHFANFVQQARTHAYNLAPNISCGASMTYGAIRYSSPALQPILNVCDVAVFTHYSMNPDFTPDSPANIPADLDALLNAAGDHPVLLQEVGFPSGYATGSQIGSSQAMQQQFIINLFSALANRPQIRLAAYMHIADWTESELDTIVGYYGIPDPKFREYMGTLGLLWADGSAKPAYAEFINGLNGM
jgi:hypothetical protein